MADFEMEEIGQQHARRLSVMTLALELRKHISQNQVLPTLTEYFPLTTDDIDVQTFNLTGKLPPSLSSEEELAMWILEHDNLNRLQLYSFFCSSQQSMAKDALTRLSNKVTSLEAAQHFADALKFFLPITGVWETALKHATSAEASKENIAQLFRGPLALFCSAHLANSSSPLFSWRGVDEQQALLVPLVDVATACIDLILSLHDSLGPVVTMSQFIQRLGATSQAGLTPRALSDLYSALIHTPIIPATLGSTRGCFFATEPLIIIPLTVTFSSVGSVQVIPSTKRAIIEEQLPLGEGQGRLIKLAWLMSDALYLFSDDRQLIAALPLAQCSVTRAGSIQRPNRLSLTEIGGEMLTLIVFYSSSNDNSSYGAPTAIVLTTQVNIDLQPSESYQQDTEDVVDHWLDKFEHAARKGTMEMVQKLLDKQHQAETE